MPKPKPRLSITVRPGHNALFNKAKAAKLDRAQRERLARELNLDLVVEVDENGGAELVKLNGLEVESISEDGIVLGGPPAAAGQQPGAIGPEGISAYQAAHEGDQGPLAPAAAVSPQLLHFGGFNRVTFAGLHVLGHILEGKRTVTDDDIELAHTTAAAYLAYADAWTRQARQRRIEAAVAKTGEALENQAAADDNELMIHSGHHPCNKAREIEAAGGTLNVTGTPAEVTCPDCNAAEAYAATGELDAQTKAAEDAQRGG